MIVLCECGFCGLYHELIFHIYIYNSADEPNKMGLNTVSKRIDLI